MVKSFQEKQLNLLYRQRRKAAAGLLFSLHALSDSPVEMNEVVAALDQIKVNVQLLEDSALDLIQNQFTWRLCEATAFSAGTILEKFEKLNVSIYEFVGLVRKVLEGIKEKDTELPPVWESKQVLKRIESLGLLCKNFITWEERPNSVFWLEKRSLSSGGIFVRFIETPLQIASTMNAGVFEPMESVVCVSATLQVARDFSYWKYRTGLHFQDSERVDSGVFDSPFDYKNNVLFSVVTDAPFPTQKLFQNWLEQSLEKLIVSPCD